MISFILYFLFFYKLFFFTLRCCKHQCRTSLWNMMQLCLFNWIAVSVIMESWPCADPDQFPLFSCFCPEYDRHLAHSKGMATAYLEPNPNHTLGAGPRPVSVRGRSGPRGPGQGPEDLPSLWEQQRAQHLVQQHPAWRRHRRQGEKHITQFLCSVLMY